MRKEFPNPPLPIAKPKNAQGPSVLTVFNAPQGMHGRYSQPDRAALMDAVKRAIVPLSV